MKTDQSDGSDSASVTTLESENLSPTQFMERRLGAAAPIPEGEEPPEPTAEIPEATEQGEEATAEEETPEQEGIGEESEAEQETEDVLSKLGIEALSPDEIRELGKTLGSKAVDRFGELTAKRKAAEEEAERLRQQLQEAAEKKNPLERNKPIEDNPFKDLDTIEALQEQYESSTTIMEWADDLLDEHEDSHLDDVITTQDGRDLTKREVKGYLKKARTARDKYLPAQLSEVQARVQGEQIKQAFAQKAEQELPWIGEADSAARKEYDAMVADPRVQAIAEKVPEVAPQLDYLLAHAVNSFMGMQEKAKAPQAPAKKATPPSPTPPSQPPSSTARGVPRDDAEMTKHLNQLNERLQQTGSTADLINLRTAQIAKRRKR